MNQQTHDRLRKWAAGKPRPLAVLGPLAAFLARPLHLLLSSDEGRELLEACVARAPQWEDYYQSDRTLFRELPPDFLGIDEEAQHGMADGDLAAVLDPGEAIILPLLKPRHQRERLERAAGLTEENVDDTLAMLSGSESAQDWDEGRFRLFLDNAGVRFVIRLVVPCFICHRETPQGMSSRATDPDSPDLDRMRSLLILDPGFIRSDAAKPVLFGRLPKQSAERLQYVRAGLGAPIDPLSLRSIKRRMAGFLSYLGRLLGTPLWGREVRKLFDIQAQHLDAKRLHDPDLPDTSESLQKMLNRQRGHWAKHYAPDNNFVAAVRALYAKAA